MALPLSIRRATRRDAAALAEFNSAMAFETERKVLMPGVIGPGVRGLLARPRSGFYLIAETGGAIAGALMITTEWSDWRNGAFWWIQSVYVRPEFRRQGIYRRMYAHVRRMAAKDRAVCGFRLYVERNNRRAQATYDAAGMERTRYVIYEQLKPGVRFFTQAAGAAAPSSPRRRARKARRTRS